jgi:hypothetical protein
VLKLTTGGAVPPPTAPPVVIERQVKRKKKGNLSTRLPDLQIDHGDTMGNTCRCRHDRSSYVYGGFGNYQVTWSRSQSCSLRPLRRRVLASCRMPVTRRNIEQDAILIGHALKKLPSLYCRDIRIGIRSVARPRWRRDYQSIVIDGYIFSLLELGIAWPSAASAFSDACCLVDRLVS